MLHYFSDESSAHYHIITGLMFAAWKLEFAMEDSEAWSKMEASSSKPVSKTLREGGGGVLPENNFSRPSEVFSWPKNKEGTHPLDSPMVWLMDIASA